MEIFCFFLPFYFLSVALGSPFHKERKGDVTFYKNPI